MVDGCARYSGLLQVSKCVVVGAGVVEQGGDRVGGGVGDGGPDGGLLHVLAVEGLDVERGVQACLDGGGGVGEVGGGVGQFVDKVASGRVPGRW
jgi:hypothetical protein